MALIENKKPRTGTHRPESGLDMKTKNGNLQKMERHEFRTHGSIPELFRETTRADGKIARQTTKRRTHWSRCVTMRETELNFSRDRIKKGLIRVDES